MLLTGTPLQNSVEELFSLLNFLEPSTFPSHVAFLQQFGDLKTEEQVEELKGVCNVSLCLFVCLFYLPVCLSVLHICLSVCVYLFCLSVLFVCLSVLFVRLSVLFVSLSVLFAHPSVYLPIHLFICMFVCLLY